jgi:hypothetical protein
MHHVFASRIDHDTVIHSTGVTVMAVGILFQVELFLLKGVGVGGRSNGSETARAEEGSEDSAFGVWEYPACG